MSKCKYSLAWVGPCGSAFVNADGWCEKHAAAKCVACGGHSTRECAHAGQFVCGSPLCDDCGEYIDSNGYHKHRRRPGAPPVSPRLGSPCECGGDTVHLGDKFACLDCGLHGGVAAAGVGGE